MKLAASILEVWHGGIPHDAPPMKRCPLAYDCSAGCGEHSHTTRISDAPFSISWQNWITYHMPAPPTLVVHVVDGGA
jgi:hypothetical protein